MKQRTGKRSLEAYKIFPYVALGLLFGFVAFLYTLVTDLQDTTSQLENQTNAMQQQFVTDPSTADFDTYSENRLQPKKDQ
jgi:uncharacterized membrane protein